MNTDALDREARSAAAELQSRGLTAAPETLELLFTEARTHYGWQKRDVSEGTLEALYEQRKPFEAHQWCAGPILAQGGHSHEKSLGEDVTNPAQTNDAPGVVVHATKEHVASAIAEAKPWDAPLNERQKALLRAADLMEENHGEIFALLAREAGKTSIMNTECA